MCKNGIINSIIKQDIPAGFKDWVILDEVQRLIEDKKCNLSNSLQFPEALDIFISSVYNGGIFKIILLILNFDKVSFIKFFCINV